METAQNHAPQTDCGLANAGRPYKLGVALSGGGARGFAHAGALMAIEEAGLKPDIVAGVSAGSVVAVLYGAGIRPQDIPGVFASDKFTNYATLSLGKGALLSPKRFKDVVLKAIRPATRLEDLALPVYLGVTDFDNVRAVEFHTGEIGPRMMASCSIPIVFPPVEIDGVSYVDGGLLRNHPAWIIRDKCEMLIGINCSPVPSTMKRAKKSLLDVAMRTYHVLLRSNQLRDMELCDLSIQTPEIARYSEFDLKNIQAVFRSGYLHTRRALREAGLWNPRRQQQITKK